MNSRPLKLALVTRRYPPLIGGAERVLSYLAAALAAEGANVTILTSQVPQSELLRREEIPAALLEETLPSQHSTPGALTVIRLNTSRLRFWGTYLYMKNLQKWFYENDIDLAYVSMLKHDAYVVIGAGKQLQFPVVLRPEGAGATGDVAWQLHGNFGRTIGRRCCEADAFVAISSSIADELQTAWKRWVIRSLWSRRSNTLSRKVPWIVSIPNGVPIPEMPWQSRPQWEAEPHAVFVGRLAPEKGLSAPIDAWPKVRIKYPRARLTLIGDGPERSILEERAAKTGLQLGSGQAVNLPGTENDPSNILRQADLFVLPSREEGMSVALLEAMALGIPLVASSIPGNCRLINNFEHGRLAPPDDADALSLAIIDQWENFDRALEMGRAARCRVDCEFSIRSMARQHLTLFHQVISGRRNIPDNQ